MSSTALGRSSLDAPASQHRLSASLPFLLYALFGAVMLGPLLTATVPPLVDYPNHLARLWILLHQSLPELAANYVTNWRILPDMAMDFVIPALSQVMPVVEAGRLFIALTMTGLVAGTIALHRVLHGRFGIWPVWSVLFIFNAVLFWGFLSCLFASAIYLFAFSGWIASERWRLFPRILLFAAVAALLFLLHAFAFGLYGLSVASYELGRRAQGRRLPFRSLVSYSLLCLQFVPGLLLWAASLGNVRSAYTAYGGLTAKLYAVMAPATFGARPALLDQITWLTLAVVLFLLLSRRALYILPQMRLPLAAMVLVAILMPNEANGSWGADFRLPVILPFVLIASTRLEIASKQLVHGIAAVATVLFGLRVLAVSQSWQEYDRWFGEFREAAAVIPAGSRLLVVQTPLGEQMPGLPGVSRLLASLQPSLFHHMGALAVLDRSVFFPYLFTQAATVDVAPRDKEIAQTRAEPVTPADLVLAADPARAQFLYGLPDVYGQPPYWRHWPQSFDYVLWIDFSGKAKPYVEQLIPAHAGSFFEIYRIQR